MSYLSSIVLWFEFELIFRPIILWFQTDSRAQFLILEILFGFVSILTYDVDENFPTVWDPWWAPHGRQRWDCHVLDSSKSSAVAPFFYPCISFTLDLHTSLPTPPFAELSRSPPMSSRLQQSQPPHARPYNHHGSLENCHKDRQISGKHQRHLDFGPWLLPYNHCRRLTIHIACCQSNPPPSFATIEITPKSLIVA